MFSSKPEKVGVIGLGIIGSRIADVLRAVGLNVYVWSRTPKPVPNFLSSPASIAEVAHFIQIFVRDAEDLIEVVEKLKPALTGKHHVINHSTVSLEATQTAGKLVQGSGAAFIDCPFTGSKLAAQAGELVYYVAGDPRQIKKVRRLLQLSSKEILEVGDRIGDATVLKIATNMISAVSVQVLAESLALARTRQIDPEKLAAALNLNACASPLLQMKLPAMLSGDFDPHFSLKNMFKDSQFALNLASEAGIELPALSTTASVMFNTIRNGHGEKDYSVLSSNYDPDQPAPENDQDHPASEENT